MIQAKTSDRNGDRLSRRKKALLSARVKRGAATAASRDGKGKPGIPRREPGQSTPLSFAQQRLWFLDQLAPGNPFYNISTALPLRFAVDPGTLERSLAAIVDRHESLRTVYRTVDGRPVQVALSEAKISWEVIDLRATPFHRRKAEAERLTAEEAALPFDLKEGPLARGKLLQLGHCDWIFLLTLHHIAADGWSMGLLATELTEFYRAFSSADQPRLADLPIQYGDFAAWQRDWFSGERLDRQLEFWRRKLEGVPTLNLPADRPRPAVSTFQGAYVPVAFSRDLSQKMRQFGNRNGYTLFMVVMAGFKALLHRYTGQDDIVVGAPIANRNHKEIEGLIGFFVNSLVLRTDAGGDPTFTEFARRVSVTAQDAYDHQDLPFEMLVERLQPERDLNRNPLFQVTLQILNLPGADGLPASGDSLRIARSTAIFDMAISLSDVGEELKGCVEFSTDCFDESTVLRLFAALEALLENAMDRPELRLSQLPLASGADQRRMESELRHGRNTPFSDQRLHDLVTRQVRKTPDRIAVIDERREWTYRELDQRSNQVANALLDGPLQDVRIVAICMDRTKEMVAGLLGILKAGKAYLPLDATLPEERLRMMVEESGAAAVLSDSRSAERLKLTTSKVALLDEGQEIWERSTAMDERPEVKGDDPAYVIYTSGSTGKPKGVIVPHRAIVNHMLWMDETFPLVESDAVLQRTPIGFDASVWEFFAPLQSGARLVMPGEESRFDPAMAVERIKRRQVTVLQLVPSLLHVLLDEPQLHECVSLRRVFCGGEALKASLCQRLLERLDVEIYNLYGPAETAVDATYFDATQPTGREYVPIGKPISNVRCHILDAERNLVPPGVLGEIYIAGAGVGLGYLNDEESTRARFLPDPANGEQRMYRTGDLGRYLADGQIEFVGRADHQVKIGGVRMELGEIEQVVKRHPLVKECLVASAQEDASGKQLIAYVERETAAVEGKEAAQDSILRHVGAWQDFYDEMYDASNSVGDDAFDTTGWTSSYSGDHLPGNEMREWLTDTLFRVKSLKPRRALEIGCGTGMILFGVAPECERYHALDFAAPVVESLSKAARAKGLEQVRVGKAAAHELDALEEGAFDTVILNSVIQYFPRLAYLSDVLDKAIRLASSGGKLFLGDIRNYHLIHEFHAEVARHRLGNEVNVGSFVREVKEQAAREKELLICPEFFVVLQRSHPRVKAASVLPKEGRAKNELNQFRYDVVIHLDCAPSGESLSEGGALAWRDEVVNLVCAGAEAVGDGTVIVGVPDDRVRPSIDRWTRLLEADSEAPLMDIESEPTRKAERGLVALMNACDKAGLKVNVSRFRDGNAASGFVDVVISRSGKGEESHAGRVAGLTTPESEPLETYANCPESSVGEGSLGVVLRQFLQLHLPDVMIPSAFIAIDEWPLTPNGKVDRRLLPKPESSSRSGGSDPVPPRSEMEKSLVAIWESILPSKGVGVRDNFFSHLGGHSLLAIQVVSHLRKELGVELPLIKLFEKPTIEELAQELEASVVSEEGGQKKTIDDRIEAGVDVESLSDDDVNRMLEELME